MKRIFLLLVAIAAMQVSGCTQSSKKTDREVGDSCEDCDMMFDGMPSTISWQTTVAGPDEPGEPMIISGIIYKKDGKTPAPDVILYFYHTDNKGLYSPGRGQTQAKRHGHLRGWVKTDANGRYEFKTIRPASYPNSKNPQHVHALIKEPGLTLYWIDDYFFDDDPLFGSDDTPNLQNRGGKGLLSLKKNEKGIWIGKRDIIAGMNIPNY